MCLKEFRACHAAPGGTHTWNPFVLVRFSLEAVPMTMRLLLPPPPLRLSTSYFLYLSTDLARTREPTRAQSKQVRVLVCVKYKRVWGCVCAWACVRACERVSSFSLSHLESNDYNYTRFLTRRFFCFEQLFFSSLVVAEAKTEAEPKFDESLYNDPVSGLFFSPPDFKL